MFLLPSFVLHPPAADGGGGGNGGHRAAPSRGGGAAALPRGRLAGDQRDVRPPRAGHRRRAPRPRLGVHPLPAEHPRCQHHSSLVSQHARLCCSWLLTPACRRRWLCWCLQMWPGLIQKAKDGGLDVIETYVFWDIHEPVRGQARRNTYTSLCCCCYSPVSLLSFLHHLLLLATIMCQTKAGPVFASSAPYALFSFLCSWVPLLPVPCLLQLLFYKNYHTSKSDGQVVTDMAVRLRGPKGPGRVRQGRRRRRPLRAPPHRALRLRRVELRVSSSL